MQTVLIAESSQRFCELAAKELEENCVVKICHSGFAALEQFRACEPDVFVLDLELPEVDGISILHTLRSAGHRTPVLALTACIYSDYVLQTLTYYDVQYILPKPCTVAAVVSNVQQLLRSACRSARCEDDDLNNLLLALSFRNNLGGYPCLVAAIHEYSADPTQQITKTVYPAVAKLCGGTPKRVERAIRGAIQDAWKRRCEPVWSMFFAPGRDGKVAAPTNSHFIARIAMSLENRKTG